MRRLYSRHAALQCFRPARVDGTGTRGSEPAAEKRWSRSASADARRRLETLEHLRRRLEAELLFARRRGRDVGTSAARETLGAARRALNEHGGPRDGDAMLAPGAARARGAAWGARAAAERRAIMAENGGILGALLLVFVLWCYAGRVGACTLCFLGVRVVLECP